MSSIDQDQEAKIKGMLSKQSAGKTPSSQAAKTPAKAAKTGSTAHKEAAKKPVATSAKSNDHADAAEHSQKTQNLLLSKKTNRRGQIRPLTAKSS